MKLPNLQNEGRKVSESFMKFHELKLSILEVSEPYSLPLLYSNFYWCQVREETLVPRVKARETYLPK